ncbi:hypothetical protein POM88_000480 [Heracleum sosnowskyi]|uniref:Retrotransposon Copia-like N-terminal domain-containing protein n=1 Tax=Heracleum sosnowskyi TaxID=360622 RepID=A0AAD8N434_9APIA|nr:hypothetical protein POM88_000480 [Heracleum sosnowskyi]
MGSDKDQPPPKTLIKIEPNSPFFLGPRDRPGDYITLVKLRTNNFDTWAYSIRMTLLARHKYGFIDVTITDSTPPCTKDDWLTIHSMSVSWIMNTIDHEVKSLLSNYENAYLLWKNLNERFSVVNGPQIQQLKSDIAHCEQSKTMPVSTYFGKLKAALIAGQGNVGTSSLSPNVGRGKSGVRALNVAIDAVPSSREATILPGFTSDQWQALVAAFGNPQAPRNRLNGPTFEEAYWRG